MTAARITFAGIMTAVVLTGCGGSSLAGSAASFFHAKSASVQCPQSSGNGPMQCTVTFTDSSGQVFSTTALIQGGKVVQDLDGQNNWVCVSGGPGANTCGNPDLPGY